MAADVGESHLDRLCRRFEIAVGNFGRSCISMRANEKAFQAWYAACVIQEFGLSRVYREVHLGKPELFELAGKRAFWKRLEKGNELFPDLSVSWEPDVDARHSSNRPPPLDNAGAMLMQFGIISELKVTGSTITPVSPGAIRQDITKLAVFSAAHRVAREKARELHVPDIAAYMIILDNCCDTSQKVRPHYSEGRMEDVLDEVAAAWPKDVSKPAVLLLHPEGATAVITTYRDFKVESAFPTASANVAQETRSESGSGTGRRKQMTADEFFAKLEAHTNSSIVQSTRSLLEAAGKHGLSIVWRAAGPAMHYRPKGTSQRFSFGYLSYEGLCGFGWIEDQCEEAGIPGQIGAEYLRQMEILLPGTAERAQPIELLVSKQTEWLAAVDCTTGEICKSLANRQVK